jgi:hypothetical protein
MSTSILQEENAIQPQDLDRAVDIDRRDALRKLGKYAAYTAPAMLTLLLPKKCLAQSGGDPCAQPDPPPTCL